MCCCCSRGRGENPLTKGYYPLSMRDNEKSTKLQPSSRPQRVKKVKFKGQKGVNTSRSCSAIMFTTFLNYILVYHAVENMVAKEHCSLLYLLVHQCFVFINSYTSREYLLVLGCFPIGTYIRFGLQAGRRSLLKLSHQLVLSNFAFRYHLAIRG